MKSNACKIKIICACCKKEFEITEYEKRWNKRKYCSPECRKQGKKKIHTCKICGKEFLATEQKNRKYCSQECATKARIKQFTVKCEICGKEFNTRQKRIEENKGRYCSKKCADISKRKSNKIIIKENHAEIVINSQKYGEKIALIDIDDIDKISSYSWNLKPSKRGQFYIKTSVAGKELKLHRLITNCPDNLVVDHINHNTLDNRKVNLRNCTVVENGRNKYNSRVEVSITFK